MAYPELTLLSKRRGLVQDHREAVATTWSLSFQKVEEQSPAAANLLRVCAFLSPDAIPEELFLQGAAVLGPHLALVAGDAFLLNQVIEVLRGYSLVHRDPERKMFSVHRLVQTVLKDGMKSVMRKRWMERVICMVGECLLSTEYEDWVQWERMLSHALVCLPYIEQGDRVLLEGANVLHQTGAYLLERGRYQEASVLLRRAWQLREGQEEPLALATTMDRMARLFERQGMYREAESWYKRALKIYEQELGPGHVDTATLVNNLAMLQYTQGKYSEAEPLLKRTLAIREQELGLGHPWTARSVNNLAILYYTQRKYAEIEKDITKSRLPTQLESVRARSIVLLNKKHLHRRSDALALLPLLTLTFLTRLHDGTRDATTSPSCTRKLSIRDIQVHGEPFRCDCSPFVPKEHTLSRNRPSSGTSLHRLEGLHS